MATPAKPTQAEVDAYFLTTPRAAEWAAVTTPDIWLNEAYRWLGQLCVDPLKVCCGMTFAQAWVAAIGELALSLSKNPTALIGGVATAGAQGAIKRNQLGDLVQEFYDTKDGQATASRFGPNDPVVLQKWPWIYDLLGCYLNVPVGGTRVIARVRS